MSVDAALPMSMNCGWHGFAISLQYAERDIFFLMKTNRY